MKERAARIGAAVVEFLAAVYEEIQREIDAWVTGGDLTFIFILSAAALIALFVLVAPSRRRS